MVTRIPPLPDNIEFRQRSEQLCAVGHDLYLRGMVPATSGNFSTRLRDGHILITESGTHKGRLQPADLLVIDASGHSLDGRRPSAETGLHLQIYRHYPEVNAVLHPHSLHATLLSRTGVEQVTLADYELLKAFPGINTHESSITLPNFPNNQDIDQLAAQADAWMDQHNDCAGYLINGHGFYTWGSSIPAAMRHVEALEFLFECEWKQRGVQTT